MREVPVPTRPLPSSPAAAPREARDPRTGRPAARPWLGRGWVAVGLLVLAGAVVFLPAVLSRYVLDDHVHVAMIDGTFPAPRGPLDLYDFVGDADRSALASRGMLPWWSHPRLTVRFFRPLSSALLWTEQRLAGRRPLLFHLHSFAWWVAAVLAARALFRRAFSPRVAGLASVVFALAPAHALPVAWLANREALVSLTFGLLGLASSLRFREERRARDGAMAAVLFALALAGGEYALCLGGYILAIELGRRGEPLVRRAVGLLPFAGPAAAYLALRAALGYGTRGSGFYADPFGEPLAYLLGAPRRLVTLLADGWLSLDHETLGPTTPAWQLALFGGGGAALFFVPLRRALTALEGPPRDAARWLLVGSFLSLIPLLAVEPSPRVLGAPLLGIAAAVAVLLDHAWFPAAPLERRGWPELTGLVALLLGFAHLVHGPATAWLVGRAFQKASVELEAGGAALRERLADPAGTELVVVRGEVGGLFAPFALGEGARLPARWHLLSYTGHALAIRRDARTLDLAAAPGKGLFPRDELFRSAAAPFAAGAVVVLPGMRVTVLEVGDEGPRSARFSFDGPLESPPLLWVSEDGRRGFPPAALPPPGFGAPFDAE